MKDNHYIREIEALNGRLPDRHELHRAVGPLLEKMAADHQFWQEVFKMNLTDKGYLSRKWTMFDIPFLFVHETSDYYVKLHLFPALESGETNVLASTIHHHNNYLLTTYAALGSGYECFLFDKKIEVDPGTLRSTLKVRDHFSQKDRRVHLVDSWEPHAVVNPRTFSATLVFWSPDKKRTTDSLRLNPVLKFFKTPLRKLIYLLGMDKAVGIAAQKTYQWYPEGKGFKAVLEEDFFAPTKAQSGPAVDDYSVQSVFHFIQQIGFDDRGFLESLKSSPDVPAYYHKWIDKLLKNEPIPPTYAKSRINVPAGRITVEEVLEAGSSAVSGL
jgi:hypothetical protein